MLNRLSIQGLAIIDSLEIDFNAGFNVITGETGAGKSILIKALGLLLGTKANQETVRAGRESAVIIGSFILPPNHFIFEYLKSLGIELESSESINEENLIIRRQILSNHRSYQWINDIAIAQNTLKICGQSLIDIFAQHENQKLLKSEEHIRYLDFFIQEKNTLSDYVEIYDKTLLNQSHIYQLLENQSQKIKLKDYYLFRIEEWNQIKPSKNDYENLVEKLDQVKNKSKMMAEIEPIYSRFSSDESMADSLKETLNLIKKAEKRFEIKELKELSDLLENAYQNIMTFESDFIHWYKSIDWNEEDFEFLQKKLFQYQDLFRKFQVQHIDDLMEQFESIQLELQSINDFESDILKKIKLLEEQLNQLEKLSIALHQQRLIAAEQIKKDVERELSDLGMSRAQFIVEIKENVSLSEIDKKAFKDLPEVIQNKVVQCLNQFKKMGPKGIDKVTFMLSANPGENPYPLNKGASGGELSRILLAIKKAMIVDAETCLLIFDEVDSGVSGKIASAVAKKLKHLSEHFQIVCISHLPQVAAFAQSHFLVEKCIEKNRTISKISLLNEPSRIKEVARLLSGEDISPESLKNAQYLIQQAQKAQRKKKNAIQLARPTTVAMES